MLQISDIILSWRTHKKNPLFVTINILGLTVAMTVIFFTAIYIRYEISYDSWFTGSDRIYRVNEIVTESSGEEKVSPSTPGGLRQVLLNDIPGIESSVRIFDWGSKEWNVTYNNVSHLEQRYMVDSTLFDVFDFEFVKGSPENALNKILSVVLTESIAEKIFGSEEPLGKYLKMSKDTAYTITGIIRDFEKPTHFTDMSIIYNWDTGWAEGSWQPSFFNTYLKLQDGSDPETVLSAINAVIKQHTAEKYARNGSEYRLELEPVRDIHLYSSLSNRWCCAEENPIPASRDILKYSLIAIVIMIIACLNYLNLTTAQTGTRIKQISVSKILGESGMRIFNRLFLETLVMATISALLSISITWMILPYIFTYMGKNLLIAPVGLGSIIGFTLALTLITSILAGLYPAFILSGISPIQKQKEKSFQLFTGKHLRSVSVIIQFSISILLLNSLLIINKQMKFLNEAPPGFNKENLMVLSFNDKLKNWGGETLRDELEKLPGILATTTSWAFPFKLWTQWPFKNPRNDTEFLKINVMSVGAEYPEVMKMDLLDGNFFNPDRSSELKRECIVNEAAAEYLGFHNPVGEHLELPPDRRTKSLEIIGLVRNFNYESLHSEIQPMILVPVTEGLFHIILRLSEENISETISSIQKVWEEYVPSNSFKYEFIDDVLENRYRSEHRIRNVYLGCTIIAIMIACMGLFGMSVYIAEQKTKEIGIRKVMGASVFSIEKLLLKGLVIQVLISNILAIPLTYILMQRWLDNYAYKINIEPTDFLITVIISLILGIVTVGVQTIRSARSNPINSLRYE